MHITVEMPAVSGCSATECAYNIDAQCHARAITIGDGLHPGCDTYFKTSGHTNGRDMHAGVGACKVTTCSYNDDFECAADSINVGVTGGSVNCLTFSPRA